MNYLIILIVLPSFVWAVGREAKDTKETKDPIANLVNEEFQRETAGVRTEWEKTAKRIEQIQTQKLSAAEDSKRRGQWESEGAELVQKFQTVMASRYHNSNGEFNGGLEVITRDVENINKVLSRYLSTAPLKGKVSAGEAMRFLEWGTKRLNFLAKTHLEPTETNNSDLELLAYQLKSAQKEQAKLVEIAKTVGLDIPNANGNVRKASPKLTTTPPAIPAPVAELLIAEPTEQVTEETSSDEPKLIRLPSSTGKKKSKSLLPSDF